jgi:aminoglycoside/choline kinase family phosphotransferase
MNPVSPASCPEISEFVRSSLSRSDFEIFALAGDASSRRYFRVVAGEESWVIMAWEPFEDNGDYPFLSVRDHFAKHEVRVPAVVAKAPALGLVMLEDLGDLTLERKFWENQSQELVIPFYQQALDELIKMHYPSTFDRTNCTAFKVSFDTEKLLWEMNYGREHLMLGVCELKLKPNEMKYLDRIFLQICNTLNDEPKFIAHRDYHSRNLMLKLGKMRVIDFQDARMGSIQYDLVSLLRDSYVQIKDEIADQLIRYYLERRLDFKKAGGLPDVSMDQFRHIYEIQTIQRCFKACGSFSSFYNLRKDTRYLKYIHHTLQTVRRSLELFPEYREFYDVLDSYGVFDRKYEAS